MAAKRGLRPRGCLESWPPTEQNTENLNLFSSFRVGLFSIVFHENDSRVTRDSGERLENRRSRNVSDG